MSLECRARLLSGSDNSHKELNTNVRDAAVPRRSWNANGRAAAVPQRSCNANGRAAAVPRQFVFLNRRQLHRSEQQLPCGYRPCHVFGKKSFSKVATVTRIKDIDFNKLACRCSAAPHLGKPIFESCYNPPPLKCGMKLMCGIGCVTQVPRQVAL